MKYRQSDTQQKYEEYNNVRQLQLNCGDKCKKHDWAWHLAAWSKVDVLYEYHEI